MKKTIALSLAMAISFSAYSLADNPESKPARRKSKEIALMKVAGGIFITGIGSIYSIVLPAMAYHLMDSQKKLLGMFDQSAPSNTRDYKRIIKAIPVSFIPLAITYAGYKLAKNGFDELDEIAQYPTIIKQ